MNACARRVCLAAVSIVLLSGVVGCVKSKTTVFVNPDGSGHLVVTRLFGRQTVESIEMQRQQMQFMDMGDESGSEEVMARMKADPFYDEKALKKEARNYGAGVKLVKSRRLDVDGGRGSIAVYSFKDINDLFVSADVSQVQNMLYGNVWDMGGMDDEDEDSGRGRRGKNGVEFSFQTGEVSRLKVLLPAFEIPDDEDGAAEDGEEQPESETDDEMDFEQMAEWFDPGMMAYPMPVGYDYRYMGRYAGNMMVQGMSAVLEIAINGKVVASTASHTNAMGKGRITLLDMDSSRRDRKSKQDSRNNDLYDYGDINRLMRGVMKMPGTIVETNREVVVSFK